MTGGGIAAVVLVVLFFVIFTVFGIFCCLKIKNKDVKYEYI
jgi:uncharacterized protein YneF (UPF0154 family)